MNTIENAYYSDQLGYFGPRTQYDLELQKKWCPTCDKDTCNPSVEKSVIISNSMPVAMPMMRTNFDSKLQNQWCSDCDTQDCNPTSSQRAVIVSNSMPVAMPMMRSSYDMAMKAKFNAGDSVSCMSGYPVQTETKENFTQGLAFNDPNNIWSYTGDINCQATCSTPCSPYPMTVSNCGGSFDIVRGAGCADTCSSYGCSTRPVSTCSNYIYNPYQDTTCGCRSGCGGGRTCSSCSK